VPAHDDDVQVLGGGDQRKRRKQGIIQIQFLIALDRLVVPPEPFQLTPADAIH
jgi:hypothetical protein